jgi:surface antigen
MSSVPTHVVSLSLAVSIIVVGCAPLEKKIASMDTCDWVGTGVGAVAGGVAGGALLGGKEGVVVGALVGGFIGNQIAAVLDCHDKKAAATAGVAAADEQVGKSVVWSSQGAKVDLAKVPGQAVTKVPVKTAAAPAAETAKSTEKASKPADKSAKAAGKSAAKTGKAPADTAPTEAKEETKVAKAPAKAPIVSEGNSGSWGYSRPVTALARTSDGRMCRNVEHVVFDAKGQQTTAVGTSCLDAENRWVIT